MASAEYVKSQLHGSLLFQGLNNLNIQGIRGNQLIYAPDSPYQAQFFTTPTKSIDLDAAKMISWKQNVRNERGSVGQVEIYVFQFGERGIYIHFNNNVYFRADRTQPLVNGRYPQVPDNQVYIQAGILRPDVEKLRFEGAADHASVVFQRFNEERSFKSYYGERSDALQSGILKYYNYRTQYRERIRDVTNFRIALGNREEFLTQVGYEPLDFSETILKVGTKRPREEETVTDAAAETAAEIKGPYQLPQGPVRLIGSFLSGVTGPLGNLPATATYRAVPGQVQKLKDKLR